MEKKTPLNEIIEDLNKVNTGKNNPFINQIIDILKSYLPTERSFAEEVFGEGMMYGVNAPDPEAEIGFTDFFKQYENG